MGASNGFLSKTAKSASAKQQNRTSAKQQNQHQQNQHQQNSKTASAKSANQNQQIKISSFRGPPSGRRQSAQDFQLM
jgi:hypothetical protein